MHRNLDDYLIAVLVALLIVILFLIAMYLSGFFDLLKSVYS
jgi:hypothetical protein